MFATLHTSAMTVRHVQTRGMLAGLGTFLRLGMSTWRQRQSLRQLDAARLADIGLTKAQASAETNRSFWGRARTLAEVIRPTESGF